MTGYDIYKRALSQLRIEPYCENTPASLPECATDFVNDIGADLFGSFHINGIFDEIEIPQSAISAFTYGVAMLLAAYLGLAEKNAFFCELYNMKRASVKCDFSSVKNVFPTA